MTVTKIKLRRFQKWESFDLELSPQITVLVGKSDSGKSSILRGFRWLATNHPEGSGFIKHGKESALAIVEVDGHRITRKKGKGKNLYTLDGAKYVSFGKGKVPDDIASVLNLGEINFASQHDPIYLFSKSSGEVARELNGVVNLASIDDALSNIAQQVRQVTAEEGVCKERLRIAKEKRDSLEWVNDAQAEFKALEALRMSAAEKSSTIAAVASLVQSLAQHKETIETAADAILCVSGIIASGEAALKVKEEADKVQGVVNKITEAKALLSEELPPIEQLDRLEELGRDSMAKRQKITELMKIVENMRRLREEIKEADEGVRVVAKELEEAMVGNCLLCGRLL